MNEIRIKFGELLKIERERRKLSLEDLAENLKIAESSLVAVELGDLSLLPSEIYYGLFAKSYSEALGIDYQRTIDAIEQELQENATRVQEPKRTGRRANGDPVENGVESEDARSRFIPDNFRKLALWMGATIVAFGLFLLASSFLGDQPNGSFTEGSDEPAGTFDPNAPDGTERYTNYEWNIQEYKKPEPFTLTLNARGESWATILSDGDTALFRRLIPGRQYETTADYRMRVSISIPSVIDIRLNGQEVDLINRTPPRISRMMITQINLDSILGRPGQFEELSVETSGSPSEGLVASPDTNVVKDPQVAEESSADEL